MILTNIERQRALVLRPQISLLPLPGLAWPVGEIARGVDQANAAVKAQAGVFSLFAPKANRSCFGLPILMLSSASGAPAGTAYCARRAMERWNWCWTGKCAHHLRSSCCHQPPGRLCRVSG
jgi:hypothetical protein